MLVLHSTPLSSRTSHLPGVTVPTEHPFCPSPALASIQFPSLSWLLQVLAGVGPHTVSFAPLLPHIQSIGVPVGFSMCTESHPFSPRALLPSWSGHPHCFCIPQVCSALWRGSVFRRGPSCPWAALVTSRSRAHFTTTSKPVVLLSSICIAFFPPRAVLAVI